MHAVQTWWCSKDTCHAVFSCDTKFLCHALQTEFFIGTGLYVFPQQHFVTSSISFGLLYFTQYCRGYLLYVSICIPVVLPSAVAFCFYLSSTVGWYEWEEQLREQNKVEITLISLRKWVTRKILAARITEVRVSRGEKERRAIGHLEMC